MMRRALATLVLALTIGAPRVVAQCSATWGPSLGVPGVDGSVNAATTWDPDGPGPATPVVVLAGRFGIAGSVLSNCVATFDPQSGLWTSLPGLAGLGNSIVEVLAVTVTASNELVVGGNLFPLVGNIARWTGSSWAPIGGGVSGVVRALAAMPNGDLVVSGQFSSAGGVPATNIARWNGTSWSPLGAGFAIVGFSSALLPLPNGDLVASGSQQTPGGYVSAARWDGASWTMMPGLTSLPSAFALLPNGDVVAGGYQMLGVNSTARWDGTQWLPMGNVPDIGEVLALATDGNGRLLTVTTPWFDWNTTQAFEWDGQDWVAGNSPGPNRVARALALAPNGDLVVAGSFQFVATTVAVASVAIWDGASWSSVGRGLAGSVAAITKLAGGDLAIATQVESPTAQRSYVLRQVAGGWMPVFSAPDCQITTLVTRPGGELVAGGSLPGGGIVQWNGTSLTQLGTGLGGVYFPRANALACAANGDVFVVGDFLTAGGAPAVRAARWNGSTWSALGNGLPVPARALLVLPNGDLAAGLDNGVQLFAGGTWTSIGSFNHRVEVLAWHNGQLVAGGLFTAANGVAANRVARLSPTGWQPLGAGLTGSGASCSANALCVLPSGDLAVAGRFTTAGSVPAEGLARWNGNTWSSLSATGGIGSNSNTGRSVSALAIADDGALVLGGPFTLAGGAPASAFARLASTCPALVAAYGAGCSGSGGANALAATTLPWIGSTFATQAAGMPGNGLALRVLGLSAVSIPLASVLPQGGGGCSLLVSPDLLDAFVPIGGAVDMPLALPASLPLVGAQLRQQVVALDLGAAGGILALTSSNALNATIGSF